MKATMPKAATAVAPPKRWSCAVDAFGGVARADGATDVSGANADSRFRGHSSASDQSLATVFDPNDRRYRCCCGQSHATTGVRIVAGGLCVTILLEFWQLCWHFLSAGPGTPSPLAQSSSSVASSIVQLLFGLFIVSTVLVGLWRESANLLLPYLLLQGIGLAAVFIIFLALFYVVVDNDVETIRAFVENHGPVKTASNDEAELVYLGWTLCFSCLCLLVIQLWLISIVFACWRYFRDKRSFFGGLSSAHTSTALVVFRPLNNGERGQLAAEEGGPSAAPGHPAAVEQKPKESRNRKAETMQRYWRTLSVDY